MKSATSTLLLLLLLILDISAAGTKNPTDSTSVRKSEIAIEVGWYSSLPLTKYNVGLPPTGELDYVFQPWSYTMFPKRGAIINLQFDYMAFSQLFLRSGISFISASGGMENDSANLRSVNWSEWGRTACCFDTTMIKKETNVKTVAIPISVGWKLDRFSIVGGIAPIFAHSIKSTSLSYVHGSSSSSSTRLDNPLWDNLWQINVDWNLSVYYMITNKFYDFEVYSSIKSDWRLWRYGISAGLRVPLRTEGARLGN
jgi:hypothetical protein